jgi:hypothetical protein
MADTLKTYSLICPDIDCAEEFDVELSPAALADGGDLIECPKCGEWWEWQYDLNADMGTDTLQLLGDEEGADETDLFEDDEAEEDDTD